MKPLKAHVFGYLTANCWNSLEGLEGGTLWEEMCHCGLAWRFQNTWAIPNVSVFLCFPVAEEPVSSQLLLLLCIFSVIMDSNPLKP